jgi:methyltransferase family protein
MRRVRVVVVAGLVAALSGVVSYAQQAQPKPFEPTVGQAGKDVVWVPTPPILVEKMLDMAAVTPKDIVMDLGSGDGRNIIGAAKRGATAIGVEYNPDMVALSQRLAKEAGVADKASFIQGDMFVADISKATVLALFLLPDNLTKLRDKFLDMKPGTRIVMNTFAIPDWEADATETVTADCPSWCTSLLYFVPAKVAGTWKLPQGELALTQTFQKVTGTLTAGGKTEPIGNPRLRGDQLTFTLGGAEYSGRVNGDRIDGMFINGTSKQPWTASRGSR